MSQMRRTRYSIETVATVNGFEIRRERIGSCIRWYASKVDAEGYRLDGSDELPSRRAAEQFAAAR
jgi:hypothetical protein